MDAVVSPPGRLPDPGFWRGKRVLLTGHTGFKGSWLARWLAGMGSEVVGFALAPPTDPSLFEVARVAAVLADDLRGDLRDPRSIDRAVRAAAPDIVLHLAAQSLVRGGYRDPGVTFATNVAGTANLLAALREREACGLGPSAATVVVTTDKVYLPNPDGGAHQEGDPIGGLDPYASSKAMVESVVSVMAALPPIDDLPGWSGPVATARAGNVIGGGDWSPERLLPDCVRAFAAGEPIALRLPHAVRPWQHVLEPLGGYLVLAEELALRPSTAPRAVNFGPRRVDELEVKEVARLAADHWGDGATVVLDTGPPVPNETGVLRLDSRLAAERLGWTPRRDVEAAVRMTVEWHRAQIGGGSMADVTDRQIREYIDA